MAFASRSPGARAVRLRRAVPVARSAAAAVTVPAARLAPRPAAVSAPLPLASPVAALATLVTFLAMLACASLPAPAAAESLSIGGDRFVIDESAGLGTGAAGDAFVLGFSSSLGGEVAGDAHMLGFSVDARARVAEDLYANGANITVARAVGDDLTATGFTVTLAEDASVGGNARIAAGTLAIEAPIEGALLAAAGTLRLDAAIGGDARLAAAEIELGEGARVGGTLSYSAPDPIEVPASVAPAARVRYLPLAGSSVLEEVGEAVREPIENYWPGLVGRVLIALTVLAFLVLLAALLFAFAPRLTESMRRRASDHAWLAILFGFIGLALLVGLVPVSVMTLVGIPFVPIAALAIVVFWILGYLLGVYVLGSRLWRAFDGSVEHLPAKLVVIGVGLLVAAALNFIPVLGWLANLVILFLGLGAISIVLLDALLARTRAAAVEGEPREDVPLV